MYAGREQGASLRNHHTPAKRIRLGKRQTGWRERGCWRSEGAEDWLWGEGRRAHGQVRGTRTSPGGPGVPGAGNCSCCGCGPQPSLPPPHVLRERRALTEYLLNEPTRKSRKKRFWVPFAGLPQALGGRQQGLLGTLAAVGLGASCGQVKPRRLLLSGRLARVFILFK